MGCVPLSRLPSDLNRAGIFGDPKVRVLRLNRRGKQTVCVSCGNAHRTWYDRTVRRVRDLPCGDMRLYLELEVRRIECKDCDKVKQEKLDWLANNPFYTKRFLLHVLPRALVRIRHYGFLANAVRRHEMARCRELLDHPAPPLPMDPPKSETWRLLLRITGKDVTSCPRCKTGRMTDTAELPRATVPWRMPGRGMAS